MLYAFLDETYPPAAASTDKVALCACVFLQSRFNVHWHLISPLLRLRRSKRAPALANFFGVSDGVVVIGFGNPPPSHSDSEMGPFSDSGPVATANFMWSHA